MPFSDPNHPLWEPGNLKCALHAAGVALWCWTVETELLRLMSRGSVFGVCRREKL